MTILEELKILKVELEETKSKMATADHTEEIEELVAKYRKELTEKYATEAETQAKDIDLEIKAVDRLIAKEEAKAEVAKEMEVEVAGETESVGEEVQVEETVEQIVVPAPKVIY